MNKGTFPRTPFSKHFQLEFSFGTALFSAQTIKNGCFSLFLGFATSPFFLIFMIKKCRP